MKKVTLALTGASGMPYALRLLECLLQADVQVYFVMSQAAQVVAALETDLRLPSKIESLQQFLSDRYGAKAGQITVFGQQHWTAPIASGSAVADAMVICPCTSGCMAAVANGNSDNLLERAADVMLKEKKPLILVLRETPLSLIHLENATRLARAGAVIMPASPGFYNKPESVEDLVDFQVARILDHLGIEQAIQQRWGC